MIYGSTDFMNFPWETIIKLYRDKLGNRNFKKLDDFSVNFLKFLENPTISPVKAQKDYYIKFLTSYFALMVDNINKKVEQHILINGDITDSTIRDIVNDVIIFHYKDWDTAKVLPTLPNEHGKNVTSKYEKDILKAIKSIFQKLPLSKTNTDRLIKICEYVCIKDRFVFKPTGIVLAGFGIDEMFPALAAFTIESIIVNKLKYRIDHKIKIDDNTRASIHSFA